MNSLPSRPIRVCFAHCVDKAIAQTQMFGVHYMPVWIYTLAAYIRDLPSIEISMYDIRIMPESTLPEADLYLMSGINQDYRSLMEFQKILKQKNPNAKVILGGPICWSYQQAGHIDKLDAFDHLVIGDGEPVIRDLIQKLVAGAEVPRLLDWNKKFEVAQSKVMDRQLMDETIGEYYGAVLEVSRGCPFLCEFCDIRIQKDNNRPHNVAPNKIVEELDYFHSKGVRQILFACDNFMGDPVWAEAVCDAILAWKEKTKASLNLYTWLTITVSNFPNILSKMRRCGFDMFFIGIESFEQNQLLETAKIQNVKAGLVDSVRTIQSHGFIVVAGIIFGFDTEPDHVYKSTLDGIMRSGLISGEPSLLTALPGTPLYKRMKYSGRLRDGKLGLGGYKYQTNIKYLRSNEKMIQNFQDFVRHYTTGKFQYNRFKIFCELLKPEAFQEMSRSGYINVKSLAKMVSRNREAISYLGSRVLKLLFHPERLFYLLLAAGYALKMQLSGKSVWKYFNFWFFVWSNSVIKFSNLVPENFDIGSVEENYDRSKLIPPEYLEQMNEPIPEHKMKAQRKLTVEALNRLIGRSG